MRLDTAAARPTRRAEVRSAPRHGRCAAYSAIEQAAYSAIEQAAYSAIEQAAYSATNWSQQGGRHRTDAAIIAATIG